MINTFAGDIFFIASDKLLKKFLKPLPTLFSGNLESTFLKLLIIFERPDSDDLILPAVVAILSSLPVASSTLEAIATVSSSIITNPSSNVATVLSVSFASTFIGANMLDIPVPILDRIPNTPPLAVYSS